MFQKTNIIQNMVLCITYYYIFQINFTQSFLYAFSFVKDILPLSFSEYFSSIQKHKP